jgi:predicted transcriptional regulator
VSARLAKVITVTCGHCNGHGRVPLPAIYMSVLDDIGDGEVTTTDLVHAASVRGEHITINAMCNRLKMLEEFGLVEKRQSVAPTGGYWYIWKRSEV